MKTVGHDFLDLWGSAVARSATGYSDVVAYYRSLVLLHDSQVIDDYQFCSCLAYPLSNDVVLSNDELIDIATEAANFEVPDGSVAAVGDRAQHINLLKQLINQLE